MIKLYWTEHLKIVKIEQFYVMYILLHEDCHLYEVAPAFFPLLAGPGDPPGPSSSHPSSRLCAFTLASPFV